MYQANRDTQCVWQNNKLRQSNTIEERRVYLLRREKKKENLSICKMANMKRK